MTELLFPAGIVRIDESRIWRDLSTWITRTGYTVTLSRCADSRFVAVLGVGKDGKTGRVWQGHSHLSIADAVAQALQMAVSERQ